MRASWKKEQREAQINMRAEASVAYTSEKCSHSKYKWWNLTGFAVPSLTPNWNNTHYQSPAQITAQAQLMSELVLIRDTFPVFCVLLLKLMKKVMSNCMGHANLQPDEMTLSGAWNQDASKINTDDHMIWTSYFSAFAVWWSHQETRYSTGV